MIMMMVMMMMMIMMMVMVMMVIMMMMMIIMMMMVRSWSIHDHDDDGDDDYDGDDDDDDDGCKCGATSGLDGTCFKIKKTYGMQKHCSIYISRNRAKNIGSKTRANKGFKTLQNQNCNFLKAKMRPNCAEKGSIVKTSRSFKLKMRLIVFLRYLKCW